MTCNKLHLRKGDLVQKIHGEYEFECFGVILEEPKDNGTGNIILKIYKNNGTITSWYAKYVRKVEQPRTGDN